MTRILYWNVENFSLTRINDPRNPEDALLANDRLNYILDSVFTLAAPDIFVVVEVSAPSIFGIWEGTLGYSNAGTGGGIGARTLLDYIQGRRRPFNEDWYLVPPLYSGDAGFRESIAVYYNANHLQFVGPFRWYQVDPPLYRACPPPCNAFTYSDPWDHCLPERLIPQVQNLVLPNAGYYENTLAGQWWWPSGPNSIFPDNGLQFPDREYRKPFLTEFLDLERQPPRLLRVYSIHTSPNVAPLAVRQLSNIVNISAPSPDYTVDIIVGDFNVDSFEAFNGPWDNNPYIPLVTNNPPNINNAFTMAFPPYNNNQFQVNDNLLPRRLTHFLTPNMATPFNAINHEPDPTHNVYPRYGYMGSVNGGGQPTDSGAIDNIFTRYGNFSGEQAQNPIIINTVVGSPYYGNGFNGVIYPSTLENPLPQPLPVGGYRDPSYGQPDQFRQWNNFGKIRSTSDHLALVIDV